jgi:hypothetical protein
MTNNNSTSNYKSFNQARNGVKIWKYQNQRSAIDVTHLLNSYREKEKGDNKELIYAGRLCFSVSSDKKYMKAYLDKKKAKTLFATIVNGTFSKMYPGGFQDFGGSVEDGKVFSNKLEIKIMDYNGKTKVAVNLQKMPGTKTPTGAYKPSGPAILTVSSMFEPVDLLEMAIEVGDFIRAAEVAAMQKGIPLNTLTNYEFEKIPTSETVNSSSNQSEIKELTQTIEQLTTELILNKKQLDGLKNLDYSKMTREEFGKIYMEVTKETNRRKALKDAN